MFLDMISYEQLTYELSIGCCVQLVFLYLLTLLVDVRFKRAFWISEILINVLLLPFRIVIPDAARVLIMLTVFMFIPVGMSRGNLLYRLGMSVAILVFSFVGEFAMSCVFMALVGQPYAQPAISEHLPAAFIGMLAMLAVGAVLTVGLRIVLRRLGVGRGAHSSVHSLAPMLVALLQPLFFLAILGSALLPLSQRGAVLSVAICAVCALEIVSVVLLYVSSEQYAAKRDVDMRAKALAQCMQTRLESYAAVVRSIEKTARLRHDLRNQMQVAQVLLSEGDVRRARGIVSDMADAARGKATD